MKISLISGEQFASQLAIKGCETNQEQILELVRAVKKRVDDIQVNHAQFHLPFVEPYHHYQTVISYGGQTYAGHGRSSVQTKALAKSLNEAVERLTMRIVFEKEASLPVAECAIWPTGQISFLRETHIESPAAGLRTSNGWAVASSAEQAARRAFLEAYERHSLQLGFWKTGGAFLRKIGVTRVGQCVVHLFKVPSTPPAVSVIVAAAQSPHFSGLAFGHQAEFSEYPNYDHVLIEAVQNAEGHRFSRNKPPDPGIDQAQRAFLESKDCTPDRFEASVDFRPGWPEKVHIATVNLTSELDLSYPLKCCWVSSPELLPLYILNRLNDSERMAMLSRCIRFGLLNPVEQTPFV